METIAVYWEPRIKTYGLKEVCGLTMAKLKVRADRLEGWSRVIGDPEDTGLPFKLVLLQYSGEREFRICLLFESGREGELIAPIARFVDKDQGETLEILSPVEMIYFFGPHFGDRYGIAHAAVRILHDGALSVLAMGCSVSFIYIVVPEGTSLRARELLAENFEIP